jgi:putative transposase
MRISTFSEEQIAYALREAESGTPVLEVCRKLGNQTLAAYAAAWREQQANREIG